MTNVEDPVVLVAFAVAEGADKFSVPEFKVIEADRLMRRPDTRTINDDFVVDLAASVRDQGLIAPLLVRPNGDNYEIIAGSHRAAACEAIGMRQIPCLVIDVGDAHAALRMIDENLIRRQLSVIEEAEALLQRKDLYVELFPGTRRGGFHGNQHTVGLRQLDRDQPRFAEDTAAKTGISERTIDRKILRAERIVSEAKQIVRGTPLETGSYLDVLAKVEPERQVGRAEADLVAETRNASAKRRRRHKKVDADSTAPAAARASEDKPKAKISTTSLAADTSSTLKYNELKALLERVAGLNIDSLLSVVAESQRAEISELAVRSSATLCHVHYRLKKAGDAEREKLAAAMAGDSHDEQQLNLLTYIAEQSHRVPMDEESIR